jgi:DNA-directed RNA polymerase subunit K/omega
MPPKSKNLSNQKKDSKNKDIENKKKKSLKRGQKDNINSESESEQSNLSDNEFIRHDNKNDEISQLNLTGGNEEDDKLDDYDEEQGDDEEKEDDDEDEDEDEKGDDEDKEFIEKNEDIKDDEDDECVYRSTKKGIIYDDDDDDDDNFFDDDVETKHVYVSNEDRITTRKLTKYERVNIIGTRAKQIELGAQKMLKDTRGLLPKQIAKLELEMKVCPIIVKRILPSGAIELIDVNTLKIIN